MLVEECFCSYWVRDEVEDEPAQLQVNCVIVVGLSDGENQCVFEMTLKCNGTLLWERKDKQNDSSLTTTVAQSGTFKIKFSLRDEVEQEKV